MKKGTYRGIRKRLLFKTALLREDTDPQYVLAQFDDLSQRESHGWHRFRKQDFISIPTTQRIRCIGRRVTKLLPYGGGLIYFPTQYEITGMWIDEMKASV